MMSEKQNSLMTLPVTTSKGLSQLQAIVAEQVGTDELKEIVKKFVDKAKGGDVGSARFVIDYLLGAKHTPTTVNVTQFIEASGDTKTVVSNASSPATPEQKICVYLVAAGEDTAEGIAAGTELPLSNVVHILDNRPQRFAVRGNRYSLTKGSI